VKPSAVPPLPCRIRTRNVSGDDVTSSWDEVAIGRRESQQDVVVLQEDLEKAWTPFVKRRAAVVEKLVRSEGIRMGMRINKQRNTYIVAETDIINHRPSSIVQNPKSIKRSSSYSTILVYDLKLYLVSVLRWIPNFSTNVFFDLSIFPTLYLD
jgi:hypothetical protein